MKFTIIIAAVAFILSGCVSAPSEDGKTAYLRNEAACKSMGKTGDEIPMCMSLLLQRDGAAQRQQTMQAQANADRARMALAAGMMNYGNALQQNAATYNANRAVNCTTTPHGTFVGGAPSSYSTSCY